MLCACTAADTEITGAQLRAQVFWFWIFFFFLIYFLSENTRRHKPPRWSPSPQNVLKQAELWLPERSEGLPRVGLVREGVLLLFRRIFPGQPRSCWPLMPVPCA